MVNWKSILSDWFNTWRRLRLHQCGIQLEGIRFLPCERGCGIL